MIWFTHCEIRLEITACKSRVSTSNLIKSNNWKNLSELHVRTNSDTRSIFSKNQADGRSCFLTWPPFLEIACALTSIFGGDVSLWRVKMACEARIWQSNAYPFLLTWIVQLTKIPNFCQTYWVSLKENDRHMISENSTKSCVSTNFTFS